MMKIYDFDGMFDRKLGEYISSVPGKYSEEEWEDIIPKLYDKFGNSKIKSLGKTPREYYSSLSDGELIGQLKSHIKNNVSVSGFLSAEIESRNLSNELLKMLDNPAGREFAMNILGSDPRAVKKYLDILVSESDGGVKSRCAELIEEKADMVVDEAVKYYEEGVDGEYMCEILSRSVVKDDRILQILLKEFRTDPENVCMHAAYLAAYGDEKAIPYLLSKIDEEGITYPEFRELKFAIETLGGEYDKERDFTGDPNYELISGGGNVPEDIFKYFSGDKKD